MMTLLSILWVWHTSIVCSLHAGYVTLYGLYVDGLIGALFKAGVRRFSGNSFVGALVYADDIVSLAPSAS